MVANEVECGPWSRPAFFSKHLPHLPHAPRSPRSPVSPGMFLETRFLRPLKISQEALAKDLGVSRRRVNELIRGHRAITPDTALRLGIYFGTGPTFWMNLQQAWEIYRAWRALRQKDERGAQQTGSGTARKVSTPSSP